MTSVEPDRGRWLARYVLCVGILRRFGDLVGQKRIFLLGLAVGACPGSAEAR